MKKRTVVWYPDGSVRIHKGEWAAGKQPVQFLELSPDQKIPQGKPPHEWTLADFGSQPSATTTTPKPFSRFWLGFAAGSAVGLALELLRFVL